MSECQCSMRERLVGDGCRYCNPQYVIDILSRQDAEYMVAAEAIEALERLARDGRGPNFTQAHVATHGAFYGIGTTTEDFCAAIVALEKTTMR